MIYKRKPRKFTPAFEVVGCFLEFENKILLLKRPLNKSQGGKWGLPGGKINNDESKLDAMLREIREETGIIVKPNDLKFFKSIYVHHTLDFVYNMFSYKSEHLQQVQINDDEHEDYMWATLNEATKLPFVEDLDNCIQLFYGKT